jgi:hypothetical protein
MLKIYPESINGSKIEGLSVRIDNGGHANRTKPGCIGPL